MSIARSPRPWRERRTSGAFCRGIEPDVSAAAEHARIESAILWGHSMMGAVALALAAARPELARGLVMVDAPIFYPDPLRQQALENLLPALETDHWPDALKRLLQPHVRSQRPARGDRSRHGEQLGQPSAAP